jgi:hypothetical protein
MMMCHARERVVAAGEVEEEESIPQAYEFAEHVANRLLNGGVQANPVLRA